MLVTTLAIVAVAGLSTIVVADSSAQDVAGLEAKDPSQSVQHLYEECTRTDIYNQFFCAGYIDSMVESMTIQGARGGESAQAFGICPKIGINGLAGRQAFTNWAQKHPEAWAAIRYMGVLWAFRETWPCT